jgi:hypothetical protein
LVDGHHHRVFPNRNEVLRHGLHVVVDVQEARKPPLETVEPAIAIGVREVGDSHQHELRVKGTAMRESRTYASVRRFAWYPGGTTAAGACKDRNAETPAFAGASRIAGAGFEHLSPTVAYRFNEVNDLAQDR